MTWVGLVLLFAISVVAVVAPLDPFTQDAVHRLSSPHIAIHPLGSDTFGRDVLARLLYAGRVSLSVGVGAVALGGVVGTLAGMAAGYHRDTFIEIAVMRTVDVVMSFPSLLLGLVVLAVLGPGVERMILAIGIVLASPFARIVHSQTLELRTRDYIAAARAMGANEVRIMARHLLPNLLGEVVVLASLLTASAIRIEASLSFIGLGVSPPTPSWGNMIRDGAPLLLNAPWLSLYPGAMILLTVLAFNLLGDSVRDRTDPRLR